VDIAVPECGIDVRAEILAIEPCPPIPPGPGRVVTGTFKHQSAAVVDVHVTGLAAPIGTTANHPFWSEDRQAFVRADELLPGDRLRTLSGTSKVLAVVTRAASAPVYNLEVQYAHVYHVDTSGVLVHNAKQDVICQTLAGKGPKRTADYTQQSRSHVSSHGHSANQPPRPTGNPAKPVKSRFRPTEGGQKFTDEVLNHPKVRIAPQDNGRILYEVDDLGRHVGFDQLGNRTRGGAVVVEGPTPKSWSTFAPDEVVTQYAK
jgi:hypothetical protein